MNEKKPCDFIERVQRQNEAARRIIAISGELHLSFGDLEEALSIVKCKAGLIQMD